MTQVLLLAKEPNQLQLMGRLSKLINDSGVKCSIILVDYFTYTYGGEFISKVRKESKCEIITTEHLFKSWQVSSEPATNEQIIKDYFKVWEGKYSFNRSLEVLLKTDAPTNPYESILRNLSISEEWKRQSHYDILRWCDDLFSTLNPCLFVSIDMETLATNAFFEMAQTSDIPFITFLESRIMNRWVARRDLGYGMSLDLQQEIFSRDYDPSHNPDVENFIEYFKLINANSYDSYSAQLSLQARKYFSSNKRYIQKMFFDLFTYLIWLAKMIKSGRSTRAYRVVRFDQSFRKLPRAEFKRWLMPYKIRYDDYFISKLEDDTEFFFWSLHDRPEGSGLVLGDGIDEIDTLVNFSKLLRNKQPNAKILVKENALMYGIRDKKIYKILLEQKNIVLINPYVSSRPFIDRSLGVIGISGTVLLEASILQKPSWAFGKPEFAPILYGSGYEGIDRFISECLAFSAYTSKMELKLRKYLKFIFDNSTVTDSSLQRTQEPELQNYNIARMFKLIMAELGTSEL